MAAGLASETREETQQQLKAMIFDELRQVDSKPYTVNALQMQQIQESVCTHFGTNMDILQNKFTEEQWNAYYEGKIEPFALQLSLVMSNIHS